MVARGRPDGTILFGSPSGPLMRVAASGGAQIAVTALDAARQETGHLNPWLLQRRSSLSVHGTHACRAIRLVGRFARCRPDAQPGARLVATLQGAVLRARFRR